jgi:putrescine transport system substrate-binding protein
MKRFFAALFLCLLSPTLAGAAERVVNIFNWSDYIDPGVLEDFTRETGIKVVYDTYDSNEMLESRLLAGATGYDIVVPSATFLERQIKAGVLQPIDRKRLANAGNIWGEIDNRLARYDPGNRHAINYMWYTTGVASHAAKVRERLGKPITSWDQVLKPEALKKLADCGVYVLDSPEDVFATTLNFLKLDPNSKREADLRRAADQLSGLRRYIKKFHSSEYINALANGDICLAIGWAGDSLQARNRAREAGSDVDVAYVIPAEGALMSLDNFAIPVDAPHVAEAYQFIDFMLRPDIAARNTKATNFANGVAPSRALIDKSIADDPAVYPADATMRRLFTVTTPNQPEQKLITRLWTTVKTGK